MTVICRPLTHASPCPGRANSDESCSQRAANLQLLCGWKSAKAHQEWFFTVPGLKRINLSLLETNRFNALPVLYMMVSFWYESHHALSKLSTFCLKPHIKTGTGKVKTHVFNLIWIDREVRSFWIFMSICTFLSALDIPSWDTFSGRSTKSAHFPVLIPRLMSDYTEPFAVKTLLPFSQPKAGRRYSKRSFGPGRLQSLISTNTCTHADTQTHLTGARCLFVHLYL